MRVRPRIVVAIVATGALASGPVANAKPRLRCSSGVTIIQDGRLRIFGIPFRDPYGTVGVDEYACLGRTRRPIEIGGASHSEGTASSDTPLVVFDGRRYLASLSTDDGEGGPSAGYGVIDLHTHRLVTFANGAFDDNGPRPFRVTAAGALVRDDYGIQVIRRGFRGDGRLVPAVGSGYEIAYVGNTIYWTDNPSASTEVARSAIVKGPVDAPENRVYDLEVLNPFRLTPRHRGCAALPGVTIAASVHVRVLARRTRQRYACALGKAWKRALGPPTGAEGELRIVADRWLLSRTATRATVIDARNGEIVTAVVDAAGDAAITSSTLAGDGTFAWLEQGGRLLARRPRKPTPIVLAEAGAAPTALASSDETIYWTAGGVPWRWHR